MKLIPTCQLLALGLALAFGYSPVTAQDSTDPYKKGADKNQPATKAVEAPATVPREFMVQTTVEWIEMKTEDAMPLLREGMAPNSPELIEKIRGLEKAGKAALVESASAVTRPGQRTSTEGVKESIYPTEFDPVGVPKLKNLNLSGSQIKEQRVEISAEAHSTAHPKAFTMRQVGVRMEVDPVLEEDGKTIEMNVAPELTRQIGSQTYGTVRIGGENVPSLEQPVFVSSKIQAALTLRTGETVLAGVTPAFDDEGAQDRTKKWLILIHAVAFPVN